MEDTTLFMLFGVILLFALYWSFRVAFEILLWIVLSLVTCVRWIIKPVPIIVILALSTLAILLIG